MLIKPSLVLFLGLLLTVIVWISTSRDRDLFLDGLIRIEAQSLSSSLEVQLSDQFSALERLALRTKTPDAEFIRDANLYVKDKPGYRAIAFADTDSTYIKMTTNPEGITMLGRAFVTNDIRKQYFDQIQQTRTLIVTSAINLQIDNSPGFFVIIPVFDEGHFRGAIIGVFQFVALIPALLENELKKFDLTIYENDRLIYSSGEIGRNKADRQASVELITDNIKWRLSITPSDYYLAPFVSNSPLYLLVGGILLSLLTALTLFYVDLTKRNNRALEIAKDNLASETLQREEAQGALYSTEENFAHLVGNIREVVWIIDIIDGRPKTAFYSPRYEEILGYPVDILYKEPNGWFADVHPDDREMVRETFADIYQESYDLEYRIIRRPDQQIRWIHARGSLIPELNRIVGTIEDISDEVANRERKQELENQLLQTQKLEAIGTLAGGIAHDFNNILTIILGNTELQRELINNNPKLVTQLESIRYATDRGTDLVKELQTFNHQSTFEPEVIELDATIKETIQVLRPGIPPDVDLQYTNNVTDASILADKNQIKQVILNLCINAYQAMEGQLGLLKIIVSESSRQSNMVQIEISDSGCGMDESVKQRMFDPFFTTKKAMGSTGLGLSTVLGIVKTHEGSIEVDSKPGKGCRITLQFPTTSLKSTVEEAQPGTSTSTPINIMFVDDEPDIINLYQRYFKRQNCNVKTFDNTGEALKHFLISPGDFDVIVTDQTMPIMTGTEFAGEIRKINSDIPIILVTGHADAMTPDEAEALGITKFVHKPITLAELNTIVVKYAYQSRNNTLANQ